MKQAQMHAMSKNAPAGTPERLDEDTGIKVMG
jgi:hypothetical protein